MGNSLIRQQNGKFAIYSTVSNGLVDWDMHEDDVFGHFASLAVVDSIRATKRLLGSPGKHKSIEDVVDAIVSTHGCDEAERCLSICREERKHSWEDDDG